MLTRDDMIREYRNRSASWPAVAIVYGILLGTMALTATAIL